MPITYDQFKAIDMRVGTIVAAEFFPKARKPAFKLKIDFGGEIGPFISQVLTLGFPDAEGKMVLMQPSKTIPNGGKLF